MLGEYWRQIEELRKQEKAKVEQEKTRHEFQREKLEKKRKEEDQREQSDLMREIEKQKQIIAPIVDIIYPILDDIRNNDPQILSSSESKLTSGFEDLDRRGEVHGFVTLTWGKFDFTPDEKRLVDRYRRGKRDGVPQVFFVRKHHPESITEYAIYSFTVNTSASKVFFNEAPTVERHKSEFDVSEFLSDPSIIIPGISGLLTFPYGEFQHWHKRHNYDVSTGSYIYRGA